MYSSTYVFETSTYVIETFTYKITFCMYNIYAYMYIRVLSILLLTYLKRLIT